MTSTDPSDPLSRTFTNGGASRLIALGLALMMTLGGLALVAGSSTAATDAGVTEETVVGPRLADKIASAHESEPIEAIVQMEGPVTESQLDDAIRLGLEVRPPLDTMPVFLVRGTGAQIQTYVTEQPVERAEWNHPIEPMMDTARQASGVDGVVGSDEPHIPGPLTLDGEAVNGSGVGIAIVDTGIDATHPDLPYGEKVLQNKKYACASPGLISTTTQRCFVNGVVGDLIADGTQQDLDTCRESNHQDGIDQFSRWVEAPRTDTNSGHGTHVAGTAAGTGAASDGEFRGVAPGAKLYGLSLGESAGVQGVLYATMEAFDWVICNHDQVTPSIEVVNNSWGTAGCQGNEASDIAEDLLDTLTDRGVTVVFAAGNDGGNGSTDCVNPYASVQTAGLISAANYDDLNAGIVRSYVNPSSSRGESGNHTTYPDVAAPGTGITAPAATGAGITSIGADARDPVNYTQATGTSMAAPHIAGIVALVEQVSDLSPEQAENLLEDTARELSEGATYEDDPFNPSDSGHAYDKGHGLVDARAAVQQAAALAGVALGDSPTQDSGSTVADRAFYLATDPTGVQNVDGDFFPWSTQAPEDAQPGVFHDPQPLIGSNRAWFTAAHKLPNATIDGTRDVTLRFWADSPTGETGDAGTPVYYSNETYEVTVAIGGEYETTYPTSLTNGTPRLYEVQVEDVSGEIDGFGVRWNARYTDADSSNALLYDSTLYPTSLTIGQPSAEDPQESPVGDGEACITSREPVECKTSIGDAIAAAVDGETITVGAGTYDETVLVNKSLTIVSAEGPTQTTIRGGDGNDAVSITADGATLDGFSVRHQDETDQTPLVAVSAANAVLETNDLRAPEGTALSITASGASVAGNTIRAPEAVDLQAAATIDGNLIGSDGGTGILASTANAPTIQNNQFGDAGAHVRDVTGTVDLRQVLGTNTFANATVVADEGTLVSGVYGDVQPALDDADAGQSVLVDPGTYATSLVVDTPGVTVCPANGARDGCGSSSVGVDATGVATTVVDVQAENVTLQGLDLAWNGTLEETVVGVRAGADGAVVRDGSITLPAAGCDPTSACEGPSTLGIRALGGATVSGLAIEATPGFDNPGEAGTTGVAAFGDQPVRVESSSFSGWTIGAITWGDYLTVTDSTFQTVFTGVQLAGDHVDVRDVTVSGANSGVYVAGGSDVTQTNVTVRGSDLALTSEPLLFQASKQGAEVDARLNHWGVAREEAIRERIGNSDDHRVRVVPYLDADGNQHPAPPEVHCSIDGTLTQVATAFSFQAAVDLDLPADCDDDARTVILHDGHEAYNGATIDTQVTLLSNATGFTRHQTDGVLAGGARVESNNHQTGIELVDGSQGSSVEGVSVHAEPVGATAITVDVPGPDADVTFEDVRVGTREHPASRGLTATDTNGVEVRSSVFVSGQPALAFENTADTEVRGSSIALSPTSPDAPTRPAGAIRVADGQNPRIHDNTIHGAQTPNSQAIALERVGQADVRDNLVEGAVVGLYLDASTGATVEDNVVLAPTTTGLTSATHGISIHEGADHALARNLVSGADTGLTVNAAPGVLANQTQMIGVATGVQVQDLTAAHGPAPQFEIHNARLATTATALGLGSDTVDLSIDAECNDWGVYHGSLIPTRISHDGTNNTVDYDPFTSADQQDPDATCLTPPDAAFSYTPETGVSRLDDVSFAEESTPGTRPIVEYRWAFGDNATVEGATEDEQDPSHSYDRVATFPVVLEVEDADGMVSKAVQEVTVENIAPELDAIRNADVHHTQRIVREITASDAEGDNLTYRVSPVDAETLPEGLTFDVDTPNDTATLDWNPTPTQYGIYEVQVTADDQQPSNSTDAQVVTLEVDNAPPVFDPQLPDSVPGAVNRTLTLDVSARDPGPDQLNNLTANLSQLPGTATFTKEDVGTGTLAWTPAPGEQGTYEVSFTATGPGRTTTDTVQLAIGDENLPPALEVTGETTVPETTNATLVAYANDTDSLDVNWTTSSEPSLDADTTVEETSEGEKLTWTARIPEDLDTATVTVTADDGFDPVQASQALTIQALPEGTARLPTEDSTGIQTANPIVGEPLTLRLDAEDPDGAVTSVTVYPEGTDGPAREMTQTSPGVWTQDWTYTTEAGYGVTYTLTDDDGLTRNVTHHVAPLENTAPDVDVTPPQVSGEAEGPQGMEVTLTGFAQDLELRDLDAADYTWNLPGGQTATGRTVTANIPVGVHTVTLAVEDPYGAVGTAKATVEVDDTIAVDAGITNADSTTRSGIPRIEPTDHATRPINGTVTLTDDLGVGVGNGNATLTVSYHGTRANQEAPLETHSVNVTTQPDGTAKWSLEQDVGGALGADQSVVSAPGYHEITVDANATSRPGAAVDDTETAQTTIAYWVGPVATGPNIVPLT